MNRRTIICTGAGTALSFFLPGFTRSAQAAAPGLDPTLPVHPLLQHGMQAEPEKKVRVIVQKRSRMANGLAIAQAAGATHIEELSLIKAHVLELPQKAIAKLALHKDVHYVSPDVPMQLSAAGTATNVNITNLKTTYPRTMNVQQLWNQNSNPSTGKGVTVAVLDTGVSSGHADLMGKVTPINVNPSAMSASDKHGHGTHVGGIIAGRSKSDYYVGIAPDAKILSVKIADDTGMAHASDLLRGLQWCYDNRSSYAIKIVNLSITSGVAESYLTSPICAAVEQLWFAGVVVIVAAGNKGTAPDAVWYSPANDPFVITVGALDDKLTVDRTDNGLADFSSRGKTQDAYAKPDVVAPGRKIVSCLASNGCTLAQQLPDRVTDSNYIRLSGTSMAAPAVAGAIALILQLYPKLTPDQVKWLLTSKAQTYTGQPDKAGVVTPIQVTQYCYNNSLYPTQYPIGTANQGIPKNTGIDAVTGTVLWGQAYWDQAYWDQAYWDQAYWDQSASLD